MLVHSAVCKLPSPSHISHVPLTSPGHTSQSHPQVTPHRILQQEGTCFSLRKGSSGKFQVNAETRAAQNPTCRDTPGLPCAP